MNPAHLPPLVDRRQRSGRWFVAAVLAPVLVVMAGVPASAVERPIADKGAAGATAGETEGSSSKRAADAALAGPYNKLNALAKSKGAVGVYYDAAAAGFVVLTPDDGAASVLAAADFREADPGVRVKQSRVDQDTLKAVTAALSSGDFHPDAKNHRYAAGHNLISDTLEVETNAPPEVMAPLLSKYGSQIKVSYSEVERTARDNDPPPHWGGAAVIPQFTTTVCTSGFTVQDGAGNRYMTTAGHCAPLLATYFGFTGQYWGLAVARAPYPLYDVELLGGSSYDPRIYGGNDLFGISRPVAGAGDPVVGFNQYCRSGTLTFEVCGLTVTGTGFLCDPPGTCTFGLVRFTGGTAARAGDSGAPFYVYDTTGLFVFARGSFVGRATEGGAEVGYAEYWSSVANVFGVSIVTF